MLRKRIESDLKQAMLAQDKEKVNVLRGIKSSFQNAEIANRAPLTKETIVSVLQKEAKQRKEAIEIYKRAQDRVRSQRELRELEIINCYLPEFMSDAELSSIIDDAIKEIGSDNAGNVIGRVIKEVGVKAEGGRVARMTREKLQKRQ